MENVPEGYPIPEHTPGIQRIRDHFSFLWNLSPVKETPESLSYVFTEDPSTIRSLDFIFNDNSITVVTNEREIEDGTVFDVTFIQNEEN